MRWLLVLLLLTGPARAEVDLDEQIDTARVQRAAGVALTVIGTAMAITSAALGGYAIADGSFAFCFDEPKCERRGDFFTAAAGLAGTSSVLMAVGLPLWATGSEKVRSLEKRVNVRGFFGQNGGGARLSITF